MLKPMKIGNHEIAATLSLYILPNIFGTSGAALRKAHAGAAEHDVVKMPYDPVGVMEMNVHVGARPG